MLTWGRTLTCGLLAAALLIGGTAQARGKRKAKPLTKARAAYEALAYDKVLPLLDRAMMSAKTLKKEAEIYELRAFVLVAFGRHDEAKAAFLELLGRRPDYTLPKGVSPKIIAAFDAAQKTRSPPEPQPPPPTAEPAPEPPSPPKPEPLAVPTPTAAEPEPQPAVEPEPAGEQPEPERLTAVAPRENEPAPLGPTNGTAPEPAVDGEPAVYETWWFWTIIGGVVVAGATTGVLVGTLQPAPPDYDTGPFEF